MRQIEVLRQIREDRPSTEQHLQKQVLTVSAETYSE